MKHTVTIIPAAPGHHAVSHVFSRGVLHVYTSPIIAWEICRIDCGDGGNPFRCATAIPADSGRFDAILHPDGRVERSGSCPSYDGSWERGDFFDGMDDYKFAAFKHYGLA